MFKLLKKLCSLWCDVIMDEENQCYIIRGRKYGTEMFDMLKNEYKPGDNWRVVQRDNGNAEWTRGIFTIKKL